METTRGNRPVPAGFSRETEIARLTAALDRALKRKGCVLMPSFALGRTQEILALLALLMRTGKIARQPIYIGGLGRRPTQTLTPRGPPPPPPHTHPHPPTPR